MKSSTVKLDSFFYKVETLPVLLISNPSGHPHEESVPNVLRLALPQELPSVPTLQRARLFETWWDTPQTLIPMLRFIAPVKLAFLQIDHYQLSF